MSEFVCKQCGKCCLESPCIFAQVKHNVYARTGEVCPELLEIDKGKYKCLLIDRSQEARDVLLGNNCDLRSQRHLKPKVDCREIILEYFPDAKDDDIGYILWNETSFPDFWNIPQDGWTASQCLRTELKRLKYGRIKTDA